MAFTYNAIIPQLTRESLYKPHTEMLLNLRVQAFSIIWKTNACVKEYQT